MPLSLVARVMLALACVGLLACDKLSQFRTQPGQVFNGEVIGSDRDRKQDESSFIREGFASHTQLDLTFDPLEASSAPTMLQDGGVKPIVPGTIDSYVCETTTLPCPASQRTPGDFVKTKLEQFAKLNQDALSQYDFPGGGRVRNYILGARFSSTLDAQTIDRNATVFVSLMENGRIETRVLAQSVLDPVTKAEALPELFGVFVLQRRSE